MLLQRMLSMKSNAEKHENEAFHGQDGLLLISAYSCIAHVLIHVLIHAQPYCTVYKDRVDTIIL